MQWGVHQSAAKVEFLGGSTARCVDHRGVKKKKEYLVRWEGYDSEEDSWIKQKNVTQSAITDSMIPSIPQEQRHTTLAVSQHTHEDHTKLSFNSEDYDHPLKIIQFNSNRLFFFSKAI
jgi:hypothetical protein